MSQFNELYQKIVNKPLTLVFNEYFTFQFYVQKNKDDSISIYDNFVKNSDKLQVRCRKLSTQNWDIVSQQQDSKIKQKLMLMFSIVETNFLKINFDQNGFVTIQSLNQLMTLNVGIVKKIIHKIYQFYNDDKDSKYRSSLTSQFKRLYSSDKGIVLKHKQIGQYLSYCGFWEKLGLNYFQVRQLPHDVYRQFVMLMNIQTQVKNSEIQKMNNKLKSRR